MENPVVRSATKVGFVAWRWVAAIGLAIALTTSAAELPRIKLSADRKSLVGEDGKPFRKPTTEEINYYRPYVFEIIRLVNPLIILLTGNVASQSVLNKTGITSLRGKWTEMDGRWIMPIFHPSYLLRVPVKGAAAHSPWA